MTMVLEIENGALNHRRTLYARRGGVSLVNYHTMVL